MNQGSRTAALALLAVLLGGCVIAPPPDHAQLVARVTAAETAFAKTMADRDHAAFLSFIAEDAVFLGGRNPLRGRAEIGEGWKGLYANPDPPFSWKPQIVEVNGKGDLASSTGPVTRPDGKVATWYYSTWRLEPDGSWRIVFDNGYETCDCAK